MPFLLSLWCGWLVPIALPGGGLCGLGVLLVYRQLTLFAPFAFVSYCSGNEVAESLGAAASCYCDGLGLLRWLAACGVFEIGLRLGGAIALLGSVAPVVALCRLAAICA